MTAQQLKNSILQMAVQGKLVPQDPNDEPASVLLERIRDEKEEMIKEEKIKKGKNPSVIFRGADELFYEKVGDQEPICIADEVPFEIPDSWEWARLGDLFCIEMGQSPNGATVSEVNIGVEFHQGKVFFGDKYLMKSNLRTQMPTKLAPAYSVLLCVRAPVGKVNITDREICIGRGLCSITPMSGMPLDFVYYMLEAYEDIFVKQGTGTTFIAITGTVVKSQLVPVPPLGEQFRIAKRIKTIIPFLEQYENSEKQLENINLLFPGQLKKSILQMAVQGKLVPQDPKDEPASVLLEKIRAEKEQLIQSGEIKRDKHESVIYRRDGSYYEKVDGTERCIDDEVLFKIPASWEWVRVGNLFWHNTGKALNSSNRSGQLLKYITTSNVYWNRFELDSLRKMYFKDSEVDKCTATKGDLLVCEGGDFGRAAIWNFDYDICIQNHIHRLRAYSPLCIEYYYYVFYLYKHAGWIGGKGIGLQGLSSIALHSLLFPLPPLKEQTRIVNQINRSISVIDNFK